MSSETSPKSSSLQRRSGPGSLSEFGQQALNWMCHDLTELGFEPGVAEWPRWIAVGFSSGLRLASEEPSHAGNLVRECASGPMVHLMSNIVIRRLDRTPLAGIDILEQLRAGLGEVLADPPMEFRSQLAGVPPAEQLAWWFRHSVVWGLQAGLNADSLFIGGLLALFDKMSLSQRFVADRLVHILRSGVGRARRFVLIEFFDYSYPARPVERTAIVKVAEKVLNERFRFNEPLDPADWIVCGFREGLFLSTGNAPLRRSLFAESTREGMEAVWSLFAKHVGPDPAGWDPQRLVREALAWLRKVHPSAAVPNCRAVEFERARHLFDFAFWMGLAAGATGRSTA